MMALLRPWGPEKGPGDQNWAPGPKKGACVAQCITIPTPVCGFLLSEGNELCEVLCSCTIGVSYAVIHKTKSIHSQVMSSHKPS